MSLKNLIGQENNRSCVVESTKNKTDKFESTKNQKENSEINMEERAENFVNIEEDIRESTSTLLSNGVIREAKITNVSKVPREQVPDKYPINIKTEHSLMFKVKMDSRKSKIYLNWVDDEVPITNSIIGRILSKNELNEGEIADINGKSILLEVKNGYYIPYMKDKESSDQKFIPQIVVTIILSYCLLFFGLSSSFLPVIFGILAYLIFNTLILPYYKYKDASNFRSNSEWNGGPLFWSFLSLFPIINIISTIFYIRQRVSYSSYSVTHS